MPVTRQGTGATPGALSLACLRGGDTAAEARERFKETMMGLRNLLKHLKRALRLCLILKGSKRHPLASRYQHM